MDFQRPGLELNSVFDNPFYFAAGTDGIFSWKAHLIETPGGRALPLQKAPSGRIWIKISGHIEAAPFPFFRRALPQ